MSNEFAQAFTIGFTCGVIFVTALVIAYNEGKNATKQDTEASKGSEGRG